MPQKSIHDIYNELKVGYYGSRKNEFDAEHFFFRWYRPISFLPSAFLIKLGVSANVVTSFGAICLLATFALIASGNLLFGALLYLFAYIIDFIDGNIARYTGKPTKLGKIFDGAVDMLTFLLFVALGFGNVAASNSSAGPEVDIVMGTACGFVFLLRCYFSVRLASALGSPVPNSGLLEEKSSDHRSRYYGMLRFGKKISIGIISGMPIFLIISVLSNLVSAYLLGYLLLLSLVMIAETLYGLRRVWLEDVMLGR